MISKSQLIKTIISLTLGLMVALICWPAQAADLKIRLNNTAYQVGDSIAVKIILVSADQPANALSGTLTFPSDKLSVSSLDKTSSLVNIWIQEPSFTNSGGQISFEGAILNPGYTGITGQILTVVFKAKKAGSVNLAFNRGSILASDGQGTAILNNLGQANFIINERKILPTNSTIISLPPIASSTATSSLDLIPPEDLFVEEINDPRGEGYAKFSLSAIDKSSGLANYILQIDGGVEQEIEGTEKTWQTPKLPAGKHRLLVQAIDQFGNSAGIETSFDINLSWWAGLLAYFDTQPQLLILVFGLFALILLIILIWLMMAWRRKPNKVKPSLEAVSLGQPTMPVNYPVPIPMANGVMTSPTEAVVIFSGRAYPTNDVSVLLADQVLARTRTGLDGRFEISLNHLPAGNYNFSLKAVDNLTQRTTTQIFPMILTAGVIIRTTDIFLIPTQNVN